MRIREGYRVMSGKLDRKGRETIREETRKEGEESAEEDSCNEKEGL